jgi:hypothetical protein
MKAHQAECMTASLFILAVLGLFTWIWLPAPGLALMAQPDIGIDYQTMKVTQAEKLTAAGMKNVRNGDGITMRVFPQEGKLLFKNIRTGGELTYPPAKPEMKGNGQKEDAGVQTPE